MEATFAPTIKMHHATRAKAARLAAMLGAEYPQLSLVAVPGDEIDHEIYEHDLDTFEITADGDDVVWTGDKVPELADVLDACAAADIDLTEDEEEEPESRSSVVPPKYREIYRGVSSTGQSNGDWLAERLTADTTCADGKMNLNKLLAVFEANGVDLNATWALARFTESLGWRGRFRMSGRNVLEKIVARDGVYFDGTGAKVTPHAGWMEAMAEKHAKWLAKETKTAAAATVSVREAVEG